MTLGEGTAIGPYRVAAKIGEGGMGTVYLAHHTLLGRPAAIKVLQPALSAQREVVDRFFNEARATTAIADPGIVQVFDFGLHGDGSAYIVMELLDGESLDARIHRGAVTLVEALRITRQVAGSLAAAHARGIVHRDLKPDNVFMVRDVEAQGGERPKLLDFGIAKLTGDGPDRHRTQTGMLLGTPIYMSPEQCRGAGVIDHRSDIYSLGCVLYHMLTGHPPFDLDGVGEIISAHLREPPRPPSAIVRGVPPAVDELVLRCLAKDPAERFATAGELAAACEIQLARITGAGALTIALPAPAVLGLPPPPAVTTLGGAAGQATGERRARGTRSGLVAGLAGLLAIGVLVGVVATRGGRDAAPAGPAAAPVGPAAASSAGPAPRGPGAPTVAPPAVGAVHPAVPPPDAGAPAGPTDARPAPHPSSSPPAPHPSPAPPAAPPRRAPSSHPHPRPRPAPPRPSPAEDPYDAR